MPRLRLRPGQCINGARTEGSSHALLRGRELPEWRRGAGVSAVPGPGPARAARRELRLELGDPGPAPLLPGDGMRLARVARRMDRELDGPGRFRGDAGDHLAGSSHCCDAAPVTRAVCLRLVALAALLADLPVARGAEPRAGSVQEYVIPSRHQGKDRRVWVYTPPGSDAARDSSLGMILAFDGGDYLNAIALPRVLDSLLAARAVPPLIAVLIDNGSGASRLDDLANRAWFVDFVGNEVVPWVRGRWPVSRDPRRSLIT